MNIIKFSKFLFSIALIRYSSKCLYLYRSRFDIPIRNSDRFRITQTSNAVQLAVEHVQREDAGHYTLIARTKANEVIRKDIELIVEDRSTGENPPIFARRLMDLSVKVGTRTRFLTEIRSGTEVKVSGAIYVKPKIN